MQMDALQLAMTNWGDHLQESSQWTNFLLWHLTRPGSAVGVCTLRAFAGQISKDTGVARQAADAIDQGGIVSIRKADDYGIENGAFRIARQAGKINEGDWTSFGGKLAAVLDSDWAFAETLLAGESEASRKLFISLMSQATVEDNQATIFWLQTIQKVDSDLRDSVGQFLVQTKRVGSLASVPTWLVTAEASLNSGGGPAAAQWRLAWGDYCRDPEHAPLLRRRLALETWGVPLQLRNMLVSAWSDAPDEYWSWRCRLANSSIADRCNVTASTKQALRDRVVPRLVLQGMQQGDLSSKQVIESFLPRAFGESSDQWVSALSKLASSADGAGAIYEAGALAARDAADKLPKVTQEILMQTSYSDPGGVDRWKKNLIDNATLARPGLAKLLSNEEFFARWRRSLYNLLLYEGREIVLVDLAQKIPALESDLQNGIVDILSERPDLLKNVIHELVQGGRQDVVAMDAARQWQSGLMQKDAANCLLWESFTIDPSMGAVDLCDRVF